MWNKGKRGLQVSWCKGLTKDSDERLRQISESLMGHSFSPETIKKMQKKASTPERREWMRKIAADRVKKWNKFGNPQKGRRNTWCVGRNNPIFSCKNTRYKKFRYAGETFRSSWELQYAKWLSKRNTQWEYEPKTFRLKPGPGKSFTYTPDFYLPEQGTYIEISAYVSDDKAEKFKNFRKKYPKVGWKLLMRPELEELNVI